MKYTYESAEKSTIKLEVKLDSKEWDLALTDGYNKNKGRFNVQGFRKGHAPRSVIEKQYGQDVFFQDALNFVYNKYFFEVLDKEPTIQPIIYPEIEDVKFDKKGGIAVKFLISCKPEVKLGDYKGINFDKVEYNVKDADVQGEIDRLLKRNSREIDITDRNLQVGDIANFDFKGTVDGVAFEGGSAENYSLEIGSNQFIPGFEDQMVGLNIGEEKDVKVKFPENYMEKTLAGKDAVFAVKLHAIKGKELPELNDEFIKDATGEESVEAFKKSTKEKLQAENDKRAERELEDKIIKKVVDNATCEVPDALIKAEIDSRIQDFENQAKQYKIPFEIYLQYMGTTKDKLVSDLQKTIPSNIKTSFVLEEIIKAENIVATEEEIENKITELAIIQKKDVEEFKKSLNENQTYDVKRNVEYQKLFDFLKANNKID